MASHVIETRVNMERNKNLCQKFGKATIQQPKFSAFLIYIRLLD